MKMKNIIYVALGFVLSLTACKKEEIQMNVPEGTIYIDRRSFSFEENFANYPNTTTEVIVDLKINVTGAPQSYDRSYQWLAQDSSTAVLGKDYEFLSDKLVVEAGELSAVTQVKLKRSPDLGEETVLLYLKLVPGEDFQAGISDFEVISALSIFVKVSQPTYWDSNYLGPFSEKKFSLLQEKVGMPYEALYEEPIEYLLYLGKLKRWGILFKRYLDQEQANSTPVLEVNGTPMRVGSYI